ncbi:MAG: 1-deoxy-D-xylulose-5-phosphate reductoisomerase, partial [bacterium]
KFIKNIEQNGGGRLLPVDSEHSALFQALKGESPDHVKNVIITASGGPFRTYSQKQIENVTKQQALNHPNWDMGPKITVDSATMMNKGLEIIEACYLFNLRPDQVKALVHPQSVVHGFVQYEDDSLLAQCSSPDMKLPIQYALFYPERRKSLIESISLDEAFQWEFEPVDTERFPAFKLARQALEEGGSYTAVLNAANEVAVGAFLNEEIEFMEIPRLVKRALESHSDDTHSELEHLLEADRWARQYVKDTLSERVAG